MWAKDRGGGMTGGCRAPWDGSWEQQNMAGPPRPHVGARGREEHVARFVRIATDGGQSTFEGGAVFRGGGGIQRASRGGEPRRGVMENGG